MCDNRNKKQYRKERGPIKVLHIFSKMNLGGAELRTVDLMPLMRERGVLFDFCTLKSGEGQLDEKVRELGGKIYSCPLRPGLMTFSRRFVKFLKTTDYDILHSHIYYFSGKILQLAAKAGIKGRIAHFRTTNDGKKVTLPRYIYHRMMKRMIDNYATAILAVCKGAMEFGWGDDWQKDARAHVIYNGLDLSPYKRDGSERASVISELGLPDKAKLLINVGRFRNEKAHDLLLKAVSKIVTANSTVHLLLVGGGELRMEMEDKSRELGIAENVHFLGVRADVPKWLKASDCFLLPSRREGLPGVVLEAIAAQLPVVATNLPGVREIAEHTDLISIVPVEDVDALVDSILKTLEKLKVQERGESIFPDEFSLSRCANEFYKIYSG